VEALRKKERQGETQKTIRIGGFLSFTPHWSDCLLLGSAACCHHGSGDSLSSAVLSLLKLFFSKRVLENTYSSSYLHYHLLVCNRPSDILLSSW